MIDMQTEKIHVNKMMDIFLKKEKAFIKDRDFVVKMLVAELYNLLDRKFVLRPVQYFYLPAYDRPVTSIAREGLAVRGYTKTTFEALKSLDTELLMRLYKLIKEDRDNREESKEKRDEANKMKREKAKKLRRRNKK